MQPGVWSPKEADTRVSSPLLLEGVLFGFSASASGRDLLVIWWPESQEAGFEEATPVAFGL